MKIFSHVYTTKVFPQKHKSVHDNADLASWLEVVLALFSVSARKNEKP